MVMVGLAKCGMMSLKITENHGILPKKNIVVGRVI